MSKFQRKNHWEKIYETKEMTEVSWYQETPEMSLNLINQLALSNDSKIIDIGGGDSFLVDQLLKQGFTEITVLDISANAIEKAKLRLGEKASLVTWIVTDVLDFEPKEKYDCWHDRAAFHFLTADVEVAKYKKLVLGALAEKGAFFLGTFSEEGPKKCSGIEIKQYSVAGMENVFSPELKVFQSEVSNHCTPFDTVQNFTFTHFERNN